ncbi:dihydroxyacetone kinase transcriptional activator DhaS [Streptococcus sciuri]|uniref:Dihydroxyacetone kinase transcriptional activator DhaS n=1 Tax=Streptococcus sciuri TaxID=2973939 RepID=A0ABT2F6R3_9STRE|nr:dihydroxyacetone kinase transcriptional activator DhaS [Streptococcus sciuri]MCS4488168.1 dihydroxyacetone kinase transcriptional activator DhaS [Streptococcus sciuri]
MMPSLITKKRIAKAFKTLLEREEFDKISIVDIMELAGIRRQTFYNHFLDKYQLMDWIFENDLQEQITNNLDFITGYQLLKELFLYFEEEKEFYVQLFAIRGQNDFYSYFITYCMTVVEKIIKEYSVQAIFIENETFLAFHQNYHAHALAEIVRCFVSHSIPMPAPNFLLYEMTNRIM